MLRITFSLCLLALSSFSLAYNFETVTNEDGIIVSKAWIEEKGVYRVKVETQVSYSIDSMLLMNTSPKSWTTWMPNVLHAEFIEPGEQEYIVHIQYESPWPVTNRESVTLGQVTKDATSGMVQLSFNTIKNEVPLSSDFERIPEISGFWQFTPLENNQVNVHYEVMVDPGGSVPKWLVNLESIKIPHQTVIKMLENIERFQGSKISWLHE
jgi:hypothetical protein